MYNFIDQVDNKNKEIIIDIVTKKFSLNKESNKRFVDSLNNPFSDDALKDLDNGFRKRIPLTDETLEKIDIQWENFKKTFFNFIKDNEITYSNFKNNKVLYNKNYIKLTKMIMNYYFKNKIKYIELKEVCEYNNWGFNRSIYSSDDILDGYKYHIKDKATYFINNKLPKEKLELVITTNFADYFLSATRDTWRSCLSFCSDWSGAYWAGLPGLAIDKNRFMVYITNGEKKSYRDIIVDKMYYRSFGIIDNENKLFTVKWYPSKPFNNNFNNLINFKSLEKNINSFNKSKYPVNLLKYKNKASCYVFQDNTIFGDTKNKENNYLIPSDKGMKTIVKNRIYYGTIFQIKDSEGLDTLFLNDNELIDYETINRHTCKNCGSILLEADIYWGNDNSYCEECYNDNFMTCDNCGSDIHRNDCYYVEDQVFCYNCYEEYKNENENENTFHFHDTQRFSNFSTSADLNIIPRMAEPGPTPEIMSTRVESRPATEFMIESSAAPNITPISNETTYYYNTTYNNLENTEEAEEA